MLFKQRKLISGILIFMLVVAGIKLLVISGGEHQAAIAQNDETTTPRPPRTEPPFFDGNRALANAEMVLEFGPRVTGSEAMKQAGDAIIERLETAGWEVVPYEFVHVVDGIEYPVRNIIAKRGEGPITMLGSHYDSRIWSDFDADVNNHQTPTPGANDGGSSTAVLLEFADVINEHYDLNEQVWLVFFDAEDNGRIPGWDWILGSRHMADNLESLGVTPEDFRLMILFDLVGESDATESENPTGDDGLFFTMEQIFPQEGNSLNSAPQQTQEIWNIAAEIGLVDIFVPQAGGPIIDDHLPFIERGIPAVDIIDIDYPFRHTTEDTLDKLSPTSLARAGQVVEIYLARTNVMQVKSE